MEFGGNIMSVMDIIHKIDETAGESTDLEYRKNKLFITRRVVQGSIFTPGYKSYFVSFSNFWTVSTVVLSATIWDDPVDKQAFIRNRIEYRPGKWEETL
jgi:hypothetical protein